MFILTKMHTKYLFISFIRWLIMASEANSKDNIFCTKFDIASKVGSSLEARAACILNQKVTGTIPSHKRRLYVQIVLKLHHHPIAVHCWIQGLSNRTLSNSIRSCSHTVITSSASNLVCDNYLVKLTLFYQPILLHHSKYLRVCFQSNHSIRFYCLTT